jgi:hypothetical protein
VPRERVEPRADRREVDRAVVARGASRRRGVSAAAAIMASKAMVFATYFSSSVRISSAVASGRTISFLPVSRSTCSSIGVGAGGCSSMNVVPEIRMRAPATKP